jgi:hypothetical protein
MNGENFSFTFAHSIFKIKKSMSEFQSFGKIIIIAGVILVFAGLVISFWDKIPLIGKLPGDIFYKGKNFTFYFPIVTSILLSLIISVILYFFRK